MKPLISMAMLAVLLPACATHKPVVAQPFRTDADSTSPAGAAIPVREPLEAYIAKVRRLAAEARPSRPSLMTVEARDPQLSAALAAVIVAPASETYRQVAEEYHRIGVLDQALEYLSRALKLDPRDWATHEVRARVLRDAGLANLALADAHRAVYFAPKSATARNTIGTIFQALGRRRLAREQYQEAIRLDPVAAYALNNLCYTRLLDGEVDRAIEECRAALAISPDMTAAQNNLALAMAAGGDMAGARRVFNQPGNRAAALYNSGIVDLSLRNYRSAVQAFTEAEAADPALGIATARRKQAQMALNRQAQSPARGGE